MFVQFKFIGVPMSATVSFKDDAVNVEAITIGDETADWLMVSDLSDAIVEVVSAKAEKQEAETALEETQRAAWESRYKECRHAHL